MRARPATAAFHYALAGVLVLGTLGTSVAQEVRYFACAQISFFEPPACAASRPPAGAVPVPQAVSFPQEAPLFSPETMAPDTPPLLVQVLETPTVEHARAFVAWQIRRQQRVQEVQQLLKALAAEPSR